MLKRILLVWLALLMFASAANAGAESAHSPSLLVYINPGEYIYETRLGVPPYYSVWIMKGPMLEEAAMKAIKPYFDQTGLCHGSDVSDVIVWLIPQLTYNPMIGRYYAKVRAQFHLGNAKHLATLKATGHYDGFIGSSYAANQAQLAFEDAMQDIMRQYAADVRLQEAVHTAVSSDISGAPCALVGMIPNP